MRVYTEATPRLIELHKNYKGRKNVITDYSNISIFDNVNTEGETGYFWGYDCYDGFLDELDYTHIKESQFIEFMGLKDATANRKEYIDISKDLLDSIKKEGLIASTGQGSNLILRCERDNVNKPSHYTQGAIEPIDYILANDMNFLEGNVIKYVTRYKHKNGLEDLKKAEFYLKKLIEEYGKV